MGTIKTTNIEPIADNGTVTLGSSGDTFTLGSGVLQSNMMYPAFAAKMSSNQNLADTTDTKLNFNTEIIDTDGAYDHSTNYRFTVPSGKAGKYIFSLQALMRSSSVSNLNYATLKIFKNGSQLLTGMHNNNSNLGYGATPHVIVMDDASAGDYYEPYGHGYSASTQIVIDTTDQGGCAHFNGYRIGS
jgi:hypothetical protein